MLLSKGIWTSEERVDMRTSLLFVLLGMVKERLYELQCIYPDKNEG